MLQTIKDLVGKQVIISTSKQRGFGTITQLINDNNQFVVKIQQHEESGHRNWTGKFITKWIPTDKIEAIEELNAGEQYVVELDSQGNPIPKTSTIESKPVVKAIVPELPKEEPKPVPTLPEPLKEDLLKCGWCGKNIVTHCICWTYKPTHLPSSYTLPYTTAPYVDITWSGTTIVTDTTIPSNSWYQTAAQNYAATSTTTANTYDINTTGHKDLGIYTITGFSPTSPAYTGY